MGMFYLTSHAVHYKILFLEWMALHRGELELYQEQTKINKKLLSSAENKCGTSDKSFNFICQVPQQKP